MGHLYLGLTCGRYELSHHSTIDVRMHGKKSSSNKKKRDYGSGRAEMNKESESAREGPGAAEYLHFGRLIGEKAEESKNRLEKSSVNVSKDPRAELYLEKWSQEEEMSYSMFETLLGGGDASMTAIKDISFDDIMRNSEEGIQAAFESIVMPRRQDQPQQESSKEEDDEIIKEQQTQESPSSPPPTYEAFQDLLDPTPKNSVENTEVGEVQVSLEKDVTHQDAEEKKQGKRRHNILNAISLSSRDTRVEAKVWQCNASGVLVDAEGVTGFVPFNQLDETHVSKVVSAQQKARISLGPQADDAAVRRGGMNVLMGSVLHVKVLRIDEELGRVIFTERLPRTKRGSIPLTQSVLHTAQEYVGKTVDVLVTNITEFGVFVTFSLPNIDGHLVGLVYVSEVSWDPNEDVGLETGQARKAKLIHVDTTKKHVFLSFKRTTPNPLLETLDTLLSGRNGTQKQNGGADYRDTMDASVDLRPLEGDLLDAVNMCRSLKEAGFSDARLGPRLRSKASSQTIEVYLSKVSDQQGSTTMIVRKGYDVQEIVVGSTDRKRLINVVSEYQARN